MPKQGLATPLIILHIIAMPCDDCFRTVPHIGTAVGRSEQIAGVETYVSEPPTATSGSKKILLYFSDVFSPFYINSQLIQDWFASKGNIFIVYRHLYERNHDLGYTVLGLDYFFGDRLEELMKQPDFDRETWRKKVAAQALECTPKWVEAVRQRYGLKPHLPSMHSTLTFKDIGTTDVKYFAVGAPPSLASSIPFLHIPCSARVLFRSAVCLFPNKRPDVQPCCG